MVRWFDHLIYGGCYIMGWHRGGRNRERLDGKRLPRWDIRPRLHSNDHTGRTRQPHRRHAETRRDTYSYAPHVPLAGLPKGPWRNCDKDAGCFAQWDKSCDGQNKITADIFTVEHAKLLSKPLFINVNGTINTENDFFVHELVLFSRQFKQLKNETKIHLYFCIRNSIFIWECTRKQRANTFEIRS